jgi:hypothetical protein
MPTPQKFTHTVRRIFYSLSCLFVSQTSAGVVNVRNTNSKKRLSCGTNQLEACFKKFNLVHPVRLIFRQLVRMGQNGVAFKVHFERVV